MKILVVDDERATRFLLTRTLERWGGYDVTAAENGEEAWKLLSAGGVRLLISDWEMPKLDGPSLCRRLRAEKSDLYIYALLLTSHYDAAHIVEGLESGADDFVAKPFNPEELRARLNVGRRMIALQDDLARKHGELARANEQLAQIASTDPLTQIGNRRSFESYVGAAHDASSAQGRSYGVVMADIDHFKSFNDRHGHSTGDQVLAAVASALRTAAGDDAGVFRFGGEEMVIVAPHVAGVGALSDLAETLRAAVAAVALTTDDGKALSVTASFGGTLYDGRERVAWGALLVRADAALYEAKGAGRNCARIWTLESASAA